MRRRVSARIVALVLVSGISLGTLAAMSAGIEPSSQVAVGAMADMQCMGGKDAHCPCGKGLDPKTGKCGNVQGGGKIGCSCKDVTSGDEAASGKCAQVGKCLADKADGKPPELPQLPQPKPGGGGGAPPQDCAKSSEASSSPADPNCPPTSYGTQQGGNLWGSVWEGSNLFASPDDTAGNASGGSDSSNDSKSAWGNLLKSLGLSKDTGDTTTPSAGTASTAGLSGTGGLSAGSSAGSGSGSGASSAHTDDFARSASTFSYAADTNGDDTASALSRLAATLRSMLQVVTNLF